MTSRHTDTELTDWARVDAMSDAEIDLSEHPEWSEAQFATASRRDPSRRYSKEAISIRLSPEVLWAFRAGGPGWQTRIDNVLLEWVRSHPTG